MSNKERNSSRHETSEDIRGAQRRAHGKLIRCYNWLREYRAELVGALAVVCGTASGWFTWSEVLGRTLLVATAVLTLVAALLVTQRSRRVSVLIEQIDTLEHESFGEKEALRELLRRSARRFLEESDYWNAGTCRLSIYGHVDDRFFLICRVSNDPAKAKPGRAWYPDDQGQISVVWGKTAVDESGWQKGTALKKAIESGMAEDVAKNLTMYPRSMTGRRVDNLKGEGTGIVLLESTEPHELDEALDKMTASAVYATLADSVAASENVFEPLAHQT